MIRLIFKKIQLVLLNDCASLAGARRALPRLGSVENMTAPSQAEPAAAAHSEYKIRQHRKEQANDTRKAVQRREEPRAHCAASIGRWAHQEQQLNRARTPVLALMPFCVTAEKLK